ncbi:MAG: cysteine desulfurase family protein [Planctomycetota bacterium]|jgi:cysteine desulfurase
MEPHIYLDANASTPLAPEVREAMAPFLKGAFGNPSSPHWAGTPAREAVERARGQIADLLACAPGEVILTSGGTESNNHAIKGVFFALRKMGNHIVTTSVEHPAVVRPCNFLQGLGAEVTVAPVDGTGRVDPEAIREGINSKTILVSVMHANNEVGTIQPIEAISRITRERGVLLHTDAAQSVGKIPTEVGALGVDLLSLAGHKVYGPKGVGALYVREGVSLEPLMHGAPHEKGRRGGTENVLLAVGLGEACALAKSLPAMDRVKELRDRFFEGLKRIFGEEIVLNGHPTECLPNTLNVSFAGKEGAEVLASLPGVAASTGAACHAGSVELSPVLKAMGVPPEIGKGAVRFSLSRDTTEGEIDYVLDRLAGTI